VKLAEVKEALNPGGSARYFAARLETQLPSSCSCGRLGLSLARQFALPFPLNPELWEIAIQYFSGNGRDGLAALDCRELEPIEDGIRQA
jgi:hypothetical protein